MITKVYTCDRCGKEIVPDNFELHFIQIGQLLNHLCPDCYKSFMKWMKGASND